MTNFVVFDITGTDAQKFLQGQLTCNVTKLTEQYQATAISNLKGRVALGIWIRKVADDTYQIVISQDCADEFAKHIKKYAAFSKLTLSAPRDIFAVVDNGVPSFSESENGTDTDANRKAWQKASIATGNYWIVKATEGLWQPQELRLHQQGGVDYDKGCYLGQEIVARLWFKAKPKHWLHLIHAKGDLPAPATQLNKDVEVVNSVNINDGYLALVIAKPTALEELGLDILDLPEALNGDVARPS